MTAKEHKSDFKSITDTPNLALSGELWGVYYENFEEYWPHYNSTAQYNGTAMKYIRVLASRVHASVISYWLHCASLLESLPIHSEDYLWSEFICALSSCLNEAQIIIHSEDHLWSEFICALSACLNEAQRIIHSVDYLWSNSSYPLSDDPISLISVMYWVHVQHRMT